VLIDADHCCDAQDDANVAADHRKSVEFIRFLGNLFLTRALKTTLASTADKPTDEEKQAETAAVEKLAKLMEPFVRNHCLHQKIQRSICSVSSRGFRWSCRLSVCSFG
jgi:hypothetical protein